MTVVETLTGMQGVGFGVLAAKSVKEVFFGRPPRPSDPDPLAEYRHTFDPMSVKAMPLTEAPPFAHGRTYPRSMALGGGRGRVYTRRP